MSQRVSFLFTCFNLILVHFYSHQIVIVGFHFLCKVNALVDQSRTVACALHSLEKDNEICISIMQVDVY